MQAPATGRGKPGATGAAREHEPGGSTIGRRLSPHAWVSSTYFAEGFPYSIVNNLVEVLFKELGASLQVIGLTALFHLPWNLKFIWGPLVDQYETKRAWIIGTEVVLSIGLVLLAMVAGAGPVFVLLSAVVLVLAMLSATHDIAIDGYYLEGLDEREQSAFVGYRAMAYKVASLIVAGPLLIAIGLWGWRIGIAVAALMMVALTVFHAFWLPRVEARRLPLRGFVRAALRSRMLILLIAIVGVAVAAGRTGLLGAWRAELAERVARVPVLSEISAAGWIALALLAVLLVLLAALGRFRTWIATHDSAYAAAFADFLSQPHVGRILAFIVLFRTGESFLVKMRWPFLRDEASMTLGEYGLANGTIGVVASFVATFIGGWLIARQGLRRWIWPFVLAQNVLNLLYAALAVRPDPASVGFVGLTTIIAVEQFGSGLGTAVFMVYIMRCCDPGHRAAHMAIVTALMSVSFTLAGVGSGFLAEAMGFASYFTFTFFASLPSMALIWFIPHLDGREDPRRQRE